MNETLEDLKNKRTAVTGALENDLDIYRQLLQDEIKRANMYKEHLIYTRKVKTITERN